jgi:hypothetical protein
MRSLHYAGEDRVYLIGKNKYTGDWEFPTTSIRFGTAFFKAKLDLFVRLTENKWRIKFMGTSPFMHTLREFTPIERQDYLN